MDTADTADTPDTPDIPEAPRSPETTDTSTAVTAPRASRSWGRTAVIAGVSALALVGAATIGAVVVKGPRMEAARDVRIDGRMGARMEGASTHDGGPMARGRAADRVLVVPARGAIGRADAGQHRDGARAGLHRLDPAARAEERAARLSELAAELGLDPDALTAAAEALHAELDAEREALREELADGTVEERRAAMQALAEERRGRMRELLIGLGADADAVDALRAEHAAERQEQMSRRGPRAGHTGGR